MNNLEEFWTSGRLFAISQFCLVDDTACSQDQQNLMSLRPRTIQTSSLFKYCQSSMRRERAADLISIPILFPGQSIIGGRMKERLEAYFVTKNNAMTQLGLAKHLLASGSSVRISIAFRKRYTEIDTLVRWPPDRTLPKDSAGSTTSIMFGVSGLSVMTKDTPVLMHPCNSCSLQNTFSSTVQKWKQKLISAILFHLAYSCA